MEAKIVHLQNEMKEAKASHMNLEQSKRLCEQKLIDLDKKHNGNFLFDLKSAHFLKTIVCSRALVIAKILYISVITELLVEHNELLAHIKRSEEVTKGQQNGYASIVREKQRLEQEIAVLITAQKAYRMREAMAHSKIQEALNVAEAAIAEKNAAIQREKDIKGSIFPTYV